MDQETLLLCGFGFLPRGRAPDLPPPRRWRLGRRLAHGGAPDSGRQLGVSRDLRRKGASGEGVFGPVVLWKLGFVKASLSIRVDELSALFLLLVSALSLAASWYAVAYTRKLEGDPRVSTRHSCSSSSAWRGWW